MKTRYFPSFILLFIAACAPATAEPGLGEVAFRQSLLDLGTDLRLMCIAAHPDDEDGATLAMYRKKFGYKTFAVIATRGEGGQNEIGPELYEELGVIRTHEQRGAAEVTGAELHFLDLPEFGYSKTLDETMEVWGHDEALGRLVRVIRQTRPDVIITNHGTRVDHGHHQALGQLTREAFDAAADPQAYTNHFDQGLEPWQPARLYLRSWRETGQDRIINISELDSLRGKTYAEIAAEALSIHESQGMDFFIRYYLTGRPVVRYHLDNEHPGGVANAGAIPAPGGVLFKGLNDRVNQERRAMSQSTKPRDALAPELLARAHEGPAWNTAAATALELRLDATLEDTELVPGQTAPITATITDFGQEDARSIEVHVEVEPWFDTTIDTPNDESPPSFQSNFEADRTAAVEIPLTISPDEDPTIPHAENLFEPHFLEPQIRVTAIVDCGDHIVTLHKDLYAEVAPAVSVEALDRGYIATSGEPFQRDMPILVRNHYPGSATDTLHVQIESESGATFLDPIELAFSEEGEERVVNAPLTLPADSPTTTYTVTARIEKSGATASIPLRVVDVSVPIGVKVGVIETYDDTFVRTLEHLDVPHEKITMEDFNPERLDEFSVIVVDMRAYMKRPDLVANNQALLDYVERGGRAIVMYQKTFEWKPEYAPYPIHVSRNRVTVEEAPIKILEPGHPLFNYPNKITEQDWQGWIQERGLYFPNEWADAYTPLVAVSDPNEDIPPGSCLITNYGEGVYFYTALGWYRQLRELHPGCIRIFANMLAL